MKRVATAASLALVLVGCLGDRSDSDSFIRMPEDQDEPAAETTSRRPRSVIVVDNQTAAPVDLSIEELNDVWIDQRVLSGELAVPIAGKLRGIVRRQTLASHGSVEVAQRKIDVVDYEAMEQPRTSYQSEEAAFWTGALLRIGDGPGVLAVGSGKVNIVTTDSSGPPTFATDGSGGVSIVPLERNVPMCTADAFGARVTGLPESSAWRDEYESIPVTAFDRDADGCIGLRFEKTRGIESYASACLPEGALPFAPTDALTAHMPATHRSTRGLRIENAAGSALELVHVTLESRAPLDLGLLELTSDADVTCASPDRVCGDVRVPAKVSLTIGERIFRQPTFAKALPDERSGGRSVFVLGAYFHPVAVYSCVDRVGDDLSYPAEVFLAIVEKR